MLYVVGDRTSAYDPLYETLWRPTLVPYGGLKHHHPSLLGELLAMPSALDAATLSPLVGGSAMAVRLDKKDNVYVVEACTPGVKRDELKIEIVGRRKLELTIEQGEKQVGSNKEGEDKVKASEDGEARSSGLVRRFFGSVVLPEDADTASPRLEYVDGVLRVRFAKLEGNKKLAIELDEEHAKLAAEVSSRLDRVKELQAQLEAEVAEAAKAEEKLRRARAEARRRIENERTALALQ
jgi:HSP20 family molecular chaperone IbpA